MLKEFLAKVECGSGQKLENIQEDNSGEYHGPFESYHKLHRIRLEKTPPKIAQLHGLAKRMNWTIKERVQCVPSHAKLPTLF